MKISIRDRGDEEEEEEEEKETHVSGRASGSVHQKNRHPAIHMKHTPYEIPTKEGEGRRRGMDGVKRTSPPDNCSGTPLSRLLGLGGMNASSPGSSDVERKDASLLGSVFSFAATPLRVAWGMVRSSSVVQKEGDGLEGDLSLQVAEGDTEDNENKDGNDDMYGREELCAPDGKSPVLVEIPNATGENDVTPVGEKSIAMGNGEVNASPKIQTPFDGVLGMLKDGPLAGGTPMRFPSPKRTSAIKKSTTKNRILTPQSVPARFANLGKVPRFTFDMTRKDLSAMANFQSRAAKQESTPQQNLGLKKSIVFGSMRGSVMGKDSSAPLAWTPLRSTPLAPRSTRSDRNRGHSRVQMIGSSRLAQQSSDVPASRKRRADDIDGLIPSVDEGSVSLLDMQRRRRFKPAEDPGSAVARRSWRAGRTPYQHMSHFRRRTDSPASNITFSQEVEKSSPGTKTTSDTARRILETLDSMEETIRKSKEAVTPDVAKRYTSGVCAAPPPGESLGGAMLQKPEKQTIVETVETVEAKPLEKKDNGMTSPEDIHWKTSESLKKHFAPPSILTPQSTGDHSPSRVKKVKRKAVDGPLDGSAISEQKQNKKLIDIPESDLAQQQTDKASTFGFGDRDVSTTSNNPLFKASCTASEKVAVAEFKFGENANAIKEKISKATSNVTPSSERTQFVFGKDKVSSPKQSEIRIGTESFPEEQTSTKPASATPAFTFGGAPQASSTPAFGSSAAAAASATEKAAPSAGSGWGSEFLKKNTQAASEATAAVEKEVSQGHGIDLTKPASATPAFTFGGAPQAPIDASTNSGVDNQGFGSSFGFGSSLSAPVFSQATAVQRSQGTMAPSTNAAAAMFSFGSSGSALHTADKSASQGHGFGDKQNPPASFAFVSTGAPGSGFGVPSPAEAADTSQKTATNIFEPQKSSGFTFGGSLAAPSSMDVFGKGANQPVFGTPGDAANVFGSASNAPFGAASATPAFSAPTQTGAFGTGSSFGFGQGGQIQFGSQNTGLQSGFTAPSPFPQPSGPSQMIPNTDNPFGGLPAGGFNVGSQGNSQSEGRRKVKVKRRAR